MEQILRANSFQNPETGRHLPFSKIVTLQSHHDALPAEAG